VGKWVDRKQSLKNSSKKFYLENDGCVESPVFMLQIANNPCNGDSSVLAPGIFQSLLHFSRRIIYQNGLVIG
jgi:hypothetical protein